MKIGQKCTLENTKPIFVVDKECGNGEEGRRQHCFNSVKRPVAPLTTYLWSSDSSSPQIWPSLLCLFVCCSYWSCCSLSSEVWRWVRIVLLLPLRQKFDRVVCRSVHVLCFFFFFGVEGVLQLFCSFLLVLLLFLIICGLIVFELCIACGLMKLLVSYFFHSQNSLISESTAAHCRAVVHWAKRSTRSRNC